MILYRAAVASSPGKGKHFNEDNFFFNSKIITEELSGSQILLSHKKDQRGIQIYAVADGAGADSYRDSASLTAAENLAEYHASLTNEGVGTEKIQDNDLRRYIDSYVKNTDKAVKDKVRELLGQRISTTIALLCIKNDKILACNAGDTRIYRFRNGKTEQISYDDTQAQRMIDKGVSSPDKVKSSPKRNKLTQYLGVLPTGETLEPHYKELTAEHGDMFIICSSAFYHTIDDEKINEILSEKKTSVEAVDALMAEAVDCGIKDDATVMAIQAKDSTFFAAAAPAAVPGIASGIAKTSQKKTEKLYTRSENADETAENEESEAHGEALNEENDDKKENKIFVPLIIALCVLFMILLLVFGIKMYKKSTDSPSATTVPTSTQEIGTPEPSPTKIPTATPTAEPETTVTPTPTPTPTPEETPEPTPTPTNTPDPGEPGINVEYITLSTTNEEMNIGETLKINVHYYPENAENKTVTYESSDESVVTVSEDGTVTALSEGTAIITVKPETGNPKTAVIVVSIVRPDTMRLSETEKTLFEGESFELTYTVEPENAYIESVEYTSSDENILTVDENGKVTAVAAGTAAVTVKLNDGSTNPIVAECTVTVNANIHAESVSLNTNSVELTVGGTFDLIAEIYPENATNKNLIWTSDADCYASVDENGKVTAIAPGTAVITVMTEDGNYTAYCDVKVNPETIPESVIIDKTAISIAEGTFDILSATVMPENADNKTVIWYSDNESVATVDSNGKVTAIAQGTAKITAAAEAAEGVYAECTVTVTAPVPVTQIELSENTATLSVGERKRLPEVKILPDDATFKNVIWEIDPDSDNPSAVELTSEGFIDAKAAGNVVIIVYNSDKTVSAEFNVTVTA